ncbi:MAG: hypothetical protein U0166_17915 [Acidobacteriota bacterium]
MAASDSPGGERPRLVFGEPESIAFKEAQEAELERLDREKAEQARRDRISAAARRRRMKQEEGYPEPGAIVAALKKELRSRDWGIPPRRYRIEARVLEELRKSYDDATRPLVSLVFDDARESGLLGRSRRVWRWTGGARVRTTTSEAAAHIAGYTVILRPEGEVVPAGAGTLVTVKGEPAVLATKTAWDTLRELGRRIEIHLGRESRLDVDLRLVDPLVLGDTLPGTQGEWGPDLALLRLPGMLRHEIAGAGKTLYEMDAEPDALLTDEHLWIVAGSPLAARPRVQRSTLAARRSEWFGSVPIDYIEVTPSVRPGARPAPFLGGLGLWSTTFSADGDWSGTATLEGVAYVKLADGGVRCHGRAAMRAILGHPPR